MGRCFGLVMLVLFLVFLTGCADFKSYMKDRGNDLADCFTARVGTCYGLGARVQVTNYFSVSVNGCIEQNQVGYFGRMPVQVKEGLSAGIPVPQFFSLFATLIGVWGKPVDSMKLLATGFFCTDVRSHNDASLPQAFSILGVNAAEIIGPEGTPFVTPKERMLPVTPFMREKFFIEFGTQLFYVCFDVGFNPVEFVDFLLGWTTLDITGDDTQTEAGREP